ncbi:epoxyqueuosine reductase [Lachnospiraceae bacterium OttesenSCG-928-D06]|nr:epoxyqueuosine reductase [Lachnospiraceae bacterium OttesenSCG-928-D06]
MSMKSKADLTYAIKMKGLELGFAKVGITHADDFADYIEEITDNPDYSDFLEYDLSFNVAKGARPREIFPEAKSIICTAYGYGDIIYPDNLSKYIGYSYLSRSYSPLPTSSCGIRVEAFKSFLTEQGCNLYSGKIAVPARRACARSGIVDFGRNNFAYTDNEGSFIILYTFLVDTELEYDEPTTQSKCPPGCTLCVNACPTKALSPGKLTPAKCVLFNNMVPFETPYDVREGMNTHIHGCDICQKACPRNKKILNNASRRDYFLEEIEKEFDIEKVLLMDNEYYKKIVYPLMHNYITDIDYFRRNAAIAMGNSGNILYIPTLKKALIYENEQVKDAVQWAINKLSKCDLA